MSLGKCRKIVICFPECNLAIYLKTVTMYVPSAPEIPHIEIWTQEESSHKPQNTRCSLFIAQLATPDLPTWRDWLKQGSPVLHTGHPCKRGSAEFEK